MRNPNFDVSLWKIIFAKLRKNDESCKTGFKLQRNTGQTDPLVSRKHKYTKSDQFFGVYAAFLNGRASRALCARLIFWMHIWGGLEDRLTCCVWCIFAVLWYVFAAFFDTFYGFFGVIVLLMCYRCTFFQFLNYFRWPSCFFARFWSVSGEYLQVLQMEIVLKFLLFHAWVEFCVVCLLWLANGFVGRSAHVVRLSQPFSPNGVWDLSARSRWSRNWSRISMAPDTLCWGYGIRINVSRACTGIDRGILDDKTIVWRKRR